MSKLADKLAEMRNGGYADDDKLKPFAYSGVRRLIRRIRPELIERQCQRSTRGLYECLTVA